MPFLRLRQFKWLKNLIVCLILMSYFSFYILNNQALQQQRGLSSDRLKKSKQNLFFEKILSGCGCGNNETKLLHNFCYRLPLNLSVIGHPFSCKHVKHAADLGMLNFDPSTFIEIESFDRKNNMQSTNAVNGFPQPAFVTAASDSHFDEVLVLISTLQQNSPSQKIILYDLGLSSSAINQTYSLCNVEYRRFKFELYPPYVANLNDFRWKPLIIAEALKEFGAVWYMDSSVVFHHSNLSHVYGLLRCRTNRTFSVAMWKSPHYLAGLPKNDPLWIESGFHPDKYKDAVGFCYKFGYMLQGFTGHGIYSATNPNVYQYIPTDQDKLKEPWAKMYEAGFVFVVRTKEVVHDVLKWYVLCALEEECMAPNGSSLSCGFAEDRFGVYAGCHRFDQSIINLLLANRNNYDSLYWTSGIVDFFNIVRGGYQTKKEKYCS